MKRNRKSGEKGGGVCLYIKEGIDWERREDLETLHIESIWIEILLKNSKSFLISTVYRPPDTSIYLYKNFNEDFNCSLLKASSECKEIIALGDFNINYNKRKEHCEFKSEIRI